MSKIHFNFRHIFITLAIVFLAFGFSQIFTVKSRAATGINRQINFQGKLVNNPSSTNVSDTTYTIVFTLYDNASGGTALWTETQNVTTKDGIFRVALGSVTAFPANFNFNWSGLYLGIKVNADSEMTPRIAMAAVPFAFNSQQVAGLTVQDSAGGVASTSATLKIGTSATNPITVDLGVNNITFNSGAYNGSTSLTINSTNGVATNITLPTSGTLCSTATCSQYNWWNQVGGLVYPLSSGWDFAVGSSATSSALFSYTGIKTGQTVASVSGQLIVMANNGWGGKVGIAKTNPVYPLDVTGDINTDALSLYRIGGNRALSADGTNLFVGNAGNTTLTGSTNTVVGYQAGIAITSGGQNTLIGYQAGNAITGNTANVLLGYQSGLLLGNNANNNTFLGWATGDGITTGDQNTCVGYNSCTSLTGSDSNNTFIGGDIFSSAGISNSSALGYNAYVGGSNSVAIGANSVVSASNAIVLGGTGSNKVKVGIGTEIPLTTFDVRGDSGTLAVASVSGKTSFASLVANNDGVGDLFSASSSGIGKFTVKKTGELVANVYSNCTLKTDTNGLFTCGTDNTGSGVNWWNQLAGALSPLDTTNDLLIGSTSTSSALFSYTGIKTGQTIASASGNLIVMANNGWGGKVGIGTTNPSHKLELASATTGAGGIGFGTDLNVYRYGSGALYIDTNGAAVTTTLGVTATAGQNARLGVFANGDTYPRVAMNSNAVLYFGDGVTSPGYDVVFYRPAAGVLTLTQNASTDSPVYLGLGVLTNVRATLDVRGASGTYPIASVSGKTSFAALVANNDGVGDLFTASQSGWTRFVIQGNGSLRLVGGQTSDIDTLTATTLKIGASTATTISLGRTGQGITFPGFTTCTLKTDGSGVLQCGTDNTGSGVNWWNQLAGALSPLDTTNDLLIGSTSTSSALFSYTGIKTGQTIASVSGQLIVMANNGWGGKVGIGTTTPQTKLDITGAVPDVYDSQLFRISSTSNNFRTLLNGENVIIRNEETSAGWARGFILENNANSPQFVLGGYGSGQTYTYTWLGTAYNSPWMTFLPNGNIGIGTTSPIAPLHISAGYANNAALIVNNLNSGDLFTASASGTTRFRIDTSGNLILSNSAATTTFGGIAYTWPTSGQSNGYVLSTNGSGTLSWAAQTGSGVNWWNQLSGALSPLDTTNDLLIGSTSTSSALFSYTGIKTGQTIASVSGNLIVMANNGWGGNVGIGYSNPGAKLAVNGSVAIGTAAVSNNSLLELNSTSNIPFLEFRRPTMRSLDFTLDSNNEFNILDTSATNTSITVHTSGKVGIGIPTANTNSLLANLDVRGSFSGILPIASFSGTTSFAGLVVDQSGLGDIFTASSSGATRFTISNQGVVTIGNGTDGLVFSPTGGGPTYSGAARPTKTITLSPEFAGAVLTASNSATTNGSMTSDASPSANFRTYYEWSSTQGSLQDYTVAVRVTLPQDFSGWNNSTSMQISYNTESSNATTNKLDVFIYNPSTSTSTPVVYRQANVSTSWTTIDIANTDLEDSPAWNTAGQTAIIYLKMYASGTVNKIRVGDIVLNYKAKF